MDSQPAPTRESIKADIESHYGFFPPFYAPALENFKTLENLWGQTLSAVAANPLPPLFRESVLARFSRYCAAPYCLLTHGCGLRALGRTGPQIWELLKAPPPASELELELDFSHLSLYNAPMDWPEDDPAFEASLRRLAEFAFLEPGHAERCRQSLARLLKPALFEGVMSLLAYLKTCHFWTEYHPEISVVADKRVLDNLDPLCVEEPLLRDFFANHNEIIQEERKTLGDRLMSEIAQRRRMQEELTRYVAEMEESRDRMQDQATQLARQAEELYNEISERKKAEESIRVYAELVKNMPIGLNVWHMEDVNDPASFRLVATNPAVARFTGLDLESSVGKHMKDIFPYLTEVPDLYAEVVRTGQPRDMGESNYDKKEAGGEGTFAVRLFPLPNECVGVSYEDVTERKRAEQELSRARDAALELARVRSEFLANMSHEIRTPLNAITGMTHLLSSTELDERQREMTSTVATAGEALLAIVNQILDFSKIEAGKMSLETVDFDIGTLMESAIELLAARAQAKGLSMGALVDDNVPTALRGDPTKIRQILINLLTNAVKFTERGDIFLKASLVKDEGIHARLRLSVSDTGIGIPQEARRRLFQAFSQADASTTRKYGGTGLGLAISRRLVELMGGEMGVDTEPGKGSTFWMEVRFEKQLLGFVGELAKVKLINVRALVLDHNATNRQILRHHMSNWQMRCDAVANESTAASLLREKAAEKDPYQFLLLDQDIPGVGVLAFALKVKTEPALSVTKMIVMTSLAAPLEREVMRAAGIVATLTKPVKQTSLFDCLASNLGESSTGARARAPSEAPVPLRKNTFRIMIVEDNPVNQRVAQLQLERLGYQSDMASSGAEALARLEKSAYDLIFMDCQMPDMDGYETTRRIREREKDGRRTPIVAMTANALDGDRARCLQAGMDDYLSKPVTVEQLGKFISRWDVLLDPSVLANLRDMGGGDNKLLSDILGRYLDDAPRRVAAVRAAWEKKDGDALERSAHSLKGASGNVGARGIWTLCERIETLGRERKPEQAGPLIEELEQEFQRIRPALEAERAKPVS